MCWAGIGCICHPASERSVPHQVWKGALTTVGRRHVVQMTIQASQQRSHTLFSGHVVQGLQDHPGFVFQFPEHLASDNSSIMRHGNKLQGLINRDNVITLGFYISGEWTGASPQFNNSPRSDFSFAPFVRSDCLSLPPIVCLFFYRYLHISCYGGTYIPFHPYLRTQVDRRLNRVRGYRDTF